MTSQRPAIDSIGLPCLGKVAANKGTPRRRLCLATSAGRMAAARAASLISRYVDFGIDRLNLTVLIVKTLLHLFTPVKCGIANAVVSSQGPAWRERNSVSECQ